MLKKFGSSLLDITILSIKIIAYAYVGVFIFLVSMFLLSWNQSD